MLQINSFYIIQNSSMDLCVQGHFGGQNKLNILLDSLTSGRIFRHNIIMFQNVLQYPFKLHWLKLRSTE